VRRRVLRAKIHRVIANLCHKLYLVRRHGDRNSAPQMNFGAG